MQTSSNSEIREKATGIGSFQSLTVVFVTDMREGPVEV
jgi:hypothetical protein